MESFDDKLLDLLDQWESRRAEGEYLSPEDLASGDSELAARLTAAIEDLKQADWIVIAKRDTDQSQSTDKAPLKSSVANRNPLGPYMLLELLGQGGMGAVFKARHTRLNKYVAIKVLSESLTRNLDAVARFDREMKAVGALEHPNIVRAMDADEDQGAHYLVMEYVDGQDLQKYVKEHGPFTVHEACRIVREAALALEHAHQAGLVHRDIKPSNLLLTKSGQIKVLDLGLARLANDASADSGLTSTGVSLGTPDYMAPEQWNDSHTADSRTDLYALGCTLYYLLVGRAPYATDMYRTVIGKMTAHAQGVIPRLGEMRHDIPPELEALFQQLLAKKPEDRVQTAGELVKRIEALPIAPRIAGDTPSAHSAPPQRAEAVQPTSPRPTGGGDVPRPSLARTLALGGLAIVTLCAGWLLYLQTRQPQKVVQRDSAEKHAPEGPAVAKSSGGASNARPEDLASPATTAPATTAEAVDSTELPSARRNGWPADAPPLAIAPFDAAQARAHQKAWADYLGVPVEWTNSIGMKFRLIPQGQFQMGLRQSDYDALLAQTPDVDSRYGPQRSSRPAKVETPFFLCIHEVRQQDWVKLTGEDGTRFWYRKGGDGSEAVGDADTTNFPAEQITPKDVENFAAALTIRDFQSSNVDGYRLPFESEWEFACRAGTESMYFAGETDEDLNRAEGKSGRIPHSVGAYEANPFGLFDMHRNVREWCLGESIDAIGASGEDRPFILRGGHMYAPTTQCQSGFCYTTEREKATAVGARLAISYETVKQALDVLR